MCQITCCPPQFNYILLAFDRMWRWATFTYLIQLTAWEQYESFPPNAWLGTRRPRLPRGYAWNWYITFPPLSDAQISLQSIWRNRGRRIIKGRHEHFLLSTFLLLNCKEIQGADSGGKVIYQFHVWLELRDPTRAITTLAASRICWCEVLYIVFYLQCQQADE